ncbi:MAG TPA: thioredoxin family protein [Clostridiales bacterium]|nr:thioredoxin family protein [Clostridiales bacterium]
MNKADNQKQKKNNDVVKLLVPLLIVLVVVAIGVFKFLQKPAEVPEIENGNPDFAYSVKDRLDVEKLKTYNLPIIIEFGASWCPPCQQMEPIMRGLNEELRDKAIIRYVDTDKIRVTDYNFQAIPTQLFINADGTPYKPGPDSPVEMDMFGNKDTNEHIYTLHTGVLSKAEIMTILKEMGMK